LCYHRVLHSEGKNPGKNHFPGIDINVAIKESTKMLMYHSAVGKQITPYGFILPDYITNNAEFYLKSKRALVMRTINCIELKSENCAYML
jgi:hypothetical protein